MRAFEENEVDPRQEEDLRLITYWQRAEDAYRMPAVEELHRGDQIYYNPLVLYEPGPIANHEDESLPEEPFQRQDSQQMQQPALTVTNKWIMNQHQTMNLSQCISTRKITAFTSHGRYTYCLSIAAGYYVNTDSVARS